MPSLAELTDYYPQQDSSDTLPVDSVVPDADGVRRVLISKPSPAPDGSADGGYFTEPMAEVVGNNGFLDEPFSKGTKIGNKLFGTGGEERYQTWPEKVIREGLSAAGNVLSGETPQYEIDPSTYDVHTSPQMVQSAQAISALAGTGGLAGADGTLGSAPFLRPALKYEGKIYKAPINGQHLDALPEHLAETFNQQAMSGEDISNFNFGFMNHKGQFLDREKALDYAIKEGLIDPSAGQYGQLTSTLMADSSKPGTAIEAMAKTGSPFYSALEHNVNAIQQGKMTGDQWLGTLSNKPGVKPEELDWTGVKDFLQSKGKEPVTKAELQEHLQNNKVEIKDVDKGSASLDKSSPYYDKELERVLNSDSRGTYDDMHLTLSNDAKAYSTLMRKHPELKNDDDWAGTVLNSVVKDGGDTKYHSYQLPGGENYREKLLTLPDSPNKFTVDYKLNGAKVRANFNSKAEVDDFINKTSNSTIPDMKFSDFNVNGRDTNAYKSSHWDEPNILAHVRMNDRIMPVEFTAEQKAALAAHENAQAKLNEIRKEQGEVAKDINFNSRSLEYDRQTKIRADMESGKISKIAARKQIEDYVEHPELKPLQDKLDALRTQENAILKSLPLKPVQQNLKSLHIEEIQSDWHQQGRDKGYGSQADLPKFHELNKQLEQARKNLENVMYNIRQEKGLNSARDSLAQVNDLQLRAKMREERQAAYNSSEEYKKAEAEVKRLGEEAVKANPVGKPPDAPFKKTWHELALKRMIREAAEKGYDRLSWTPGEAQAARYDLSKSVEKIHYDENGLLTAYDKSGKKIIEKTVEDKELPDIIGKEAADKLIKTKLDPEGNRILNNADLKIGGEGMKGFYDQIVPKALEKISGEKVKSGKVGRSLDEELKNRGLSMKSFDELPLSQRNKILEKVDAGKPIHYIDIPQSLKDKAMSKGFPLFSSTHMFTPIQGDPFKSDKSK